jgi:hypothetical protein
VEKYFRPISLVVGILLVGAIAWWLIRRARAKRQETAPRR